MVNTWNWFKCLLLLVCLSGWTAAVQAQTKGCHLIAHLNESPDQVQQAGLVLPRWYSLHHRLLKLLTDRAHCQLTVVGSPWPRSLALLEHGEIHLMLTMSYTKERERFADFIGPHYMEESILVLDKSMVNKVQDLRDIILLPGSIGVLRDAYYGDEFAALLKDPQFNERLLFAGSLTQKLNMLQRGRVIGMVEDKTQFLEWSRTYPELADRYVQVLTLYRNPVYIVASKKGVPDELRQRLKRAWQEVYGSPEHLKILQEFGWSLN